MLRCYPFAKVLMLLLVAGLQQLLHSRQEWVWTSRLSGSGYDFVLLASFVYNLKSPFVHAPE